MYNPASTVFIADDNPRNLSLLSSILEEAGYTVRAAISGGELLEGIELSIPDLVILDIHMPKMDGYEVCEAMKADERYNEIPVIFCSALNESYNIVKGFDAGAVDFISKPFRSEEILARVKTHLTLQQRHTQLKNALETLKAAQQQLIQTEKMTSVGILTAGIAHQINNPLNYIVNSLEGFKKDFEDIISLVEFYGANEEQQSPDFQEKAEALRTEIGYPKLVEEMKALFDGIYTGSMKVHETIKALQAFTTDTSGEAVEISVEDEIQRAVLMMENQFNGTVRLNSSISKLPEIEGRPGTISQVVMQLLQNGLDAIKEKDQPSDNDAVSLKAEITGGRGNSQVEIRVHDTGAGMQGTAVEHAFDPFFTTSKTNLRNGLGLTKCYRIVTSLGGSLEFDSTEDDGTTVTIRLPLLR